jgi:predicted secreted protein with PEFG-CTERM motif
MNTLYAAIAVIAILATGVSIPAHAQFVDAITVTTDKKSYEDGDTIVVTGQVRERLAGYPVTLQVIAANGNLVTVEQLDVSSDMTYGVDITAGGTLWRSAGTYTIKVLYGTDTRTAETQFEFAGSSGTTPGKFFMVEGSDDPITYSIIGGKVISIRADVDSKSIIVELETTSDGELTITLPRSVIDSRLGADGKSGTDQPFIILVDGAELLTMPSERATATDRTLTIPFTDGTTQIEIIGTWVIPEFGAIAVMILAVAIISIIAVTARSRLNIIPKY